MKLIVSYKCIIDTDSQGCFEYSSFEYKYEYEYLPYENIGPSDEIKPACTNDYY